MNERLREALRRKIARHNKFVRLYALWSGFLILGMWIAIYLVSRWALILSRTIVQGVDAEPPNRFGWGFFLFVGLWFVAAWFEQKRQPAYLRSNDRTLAEIFLELALFPPRATLSTIRHAGERVTLQESELVMATDLLERIGRAGKIPIQAAEFFHPEAHHQNLCDALQTLDLVQVRRVKGEEFFIITDPQRLAAFL